jgi:alkaline phosphatase
MKRALLALALLLAGAAGGWWWGRRQGGYVVRGVAAAGGLAPAAAASRLELPALAERPVRNVVLFVGDGMGVTQTTVARIRAFGPDGRFLFERFPVTGLLTTHAADDLVTDSAASATAFATGARTDYRRTGTDPAGRPLVSLFELARDAGWATGFATSTEIVDATPASFLAHVASRSERETIAAQIAASRVDLLLGGGRSWFLPEAAGGKRRDGLDLLAAAGGGGVALAGTAAEVDAAARLPLWGLFDDSTLGEDPAHPNLAEMTAKALDLLAAEADRRGTGFLLVAEEEAIDSAAHNAQLDRMTRGVLRLDAAVEVAARLASERGDTLVLALADHSTGGLVIQPESDATTLRVAWTTGNHAGEPVAIYAYGPGPAAARFTGLHELTDVHHLVADAVGWRTAPPAAAVAASAGEPTERTRP